MPDTIRQVIIRAKQGEVLTVARYDVSKQLLYKQNRSYDLEICLDDFLDRLTITKQHAKEFGHKVEESRVKREALWPQARETYSPRRGGSC